MARGRGYQQAQFGRAVTGVQIGQGALDRAGVGAGRLVVDARPAPDAGQHRRRVAERRDAPGMAVAGGLDAREPGGRERIYGGDLVHGREREGLVLQPVAGEAFADDDLSGHR